MIAAQAIMFREISEAVRKRLPSLDHLQMGGLMTMEECENFKEIVAANNDPYITLYSVPMHWACTLLHKLYAEKRITNEIGFVRTLKEMSNFRTNLGTVYGYDWITVPLVYTHVVTIATYTFCMATLISGQYDEVEPGSIYIRFLSPFFVFLQFLFYMGWLKVAEVLINPTGCDDDDFELNYILDRNIKVAFLIVDNNYNVSPKLVIDNFKEHKNSLTPLFPKFIPMNDPPRGSVANLQIPLEQQEIFKYLSKKK